MPPCQEHLALEDLIKDLSRRELRIRWRPTPRPQPSPDRSGPGWRPNQVGKSVHARALGPFLKYILPPAQQWMGNRDRVLDLASRCKVGTTSSSSSPS